LRGRCERAASSAAREVDGGEGDGPSQVGPGDRAIDDLATRAFGHEMKDGADGEVRRWAPGEQWTRKPGPAQASTVQDVGPIEDRDVSGLEGAGRAATPREDIHGESDLVRGESEAGVIGNRPEECEVPNGPPQGWIGSVRDCQAQVAGAAIGGELACEPPTLDGVVQDSRVGVEDLGARLIEKGGECDLAQRRALASREPQPKIDGLH